MSNVATDPILKDLVVWAICSAFLYLVVNFCSSFLYLEHTCCETHDDVFYLFYLQVLFFSNFMLLFFFYLHVFASVAARW